MQHKQKIVCFGEVLWDVFPEEQKPGGAPMNVAVHLTNFDYVPTLVSSVGSDKSGEVLLNFIREKGIDSRYIQINQKHPTGVVNVQVEASGDAKYDIVFPSAWDFTEEPTTLDPGYSLIFGSLGARNSVAEKTLLKLIGNAKLAIFDVNFRAPYYTKERVEQLLAKSDIVKLNGEEIEIICSWFGKQSVPLEEQCAYLQERYDLDQIIVTLGNKGAAVYVHGNYFQNPGYSVEVKDTVGSGDSFLASYLAHYFDGVPIEECLDVACATGAYVATQIGAVPEYQMSDIRQIQHKQ